VHPPVVGREIKMGAIEACSKPPFIDMVFPLINVLGAAGFVLEPVVKPAADDGDAIR
jgi:hypothetical protein